MRLARWLVPVAVLAFALVPVSAAAHPILVAATPPSGSSAAAPPGRIVLSFAEALDPASSAALVSGDGHPIPWPVTVSGGTLALQPPALPPGTWRVRWAAVGADGDHEAGEYRFVVTPVAAATPPATAAAPPGPVERAGGLLMLALGVPLVGLLLLGGALLPADPARRAGTGGRLAGVRSTLWALLLLGLCGFTAGLVAAGGSGMLLMTPSGPPLLVAIGVTTALGVAVFDGGALRCGELASRPTTVLGMGLAPVLLASLVALAEAPSGDLPATVAGVLALGGLGTAAVAAIAGAAELTRLLPRAVVALGLLAAAAALHPDPVTRGAAIAGGVVGATLLLRGGAPGRVWHLVRGLRAPAAPRALSLPGAGAPRFARAPEPPPPPAEGHPLPAGTTVHRQLSGHFVDLARLLESLEWTSFTGYVRVDDGGLGGVLVLVDGAVAAACLAGDDPAVGVEAVQRLIRDVSGGRALLDVVGLEHETARAVVDLLSAPPLFRGLKARMVNLDGVLEDLCSRARDGTVVVSSPEDTGVILVRAGGVHGAYTRSRPRLHDTPAVVTALAGDDEAVVEVRVAPARPDAEPDVEEVLEEGGGAVWDRWHQQRRHASGRE
ncbi:MAG TPA: copper resistance CopC family protein [Candidatus Dormibacteraeota bacterium]|nr:copper resistance CopC family protein [Candidatus Dormibacteraeota bacterium]